MKKIDISFTKKLLLILIISLGLGSTVAAQALAPAEEIASNDTFLWGILVMEGILVILGLVLIFIILKMNTILFGKKESAEEELFATPGVLDVWWQKLTDMVPVDKEEEVMTDHEYDGIIELDNNLPPWWKMLFNLCILFAAVYIGYYHFSDAGESQEEEYIASMEQAEAEVQAYMAQRANAIDELNVIAVSEESELAKGKQIFEVSCAACHGKEGQGGVGPNMTDNYWIHGGDVKDVFKTIKYGVPAKGMIPWKSQLTPAQMQQVASYILTLVGTEPPNPKEPQGELYEPADKDESTNMSEVKKSDKEKYLSHIK
jgi:cytochrome c oxidase cbb3-type subunit 3